MRIRVARRDDDAGLRLIDSETWSSEINPGPPPSPERPFFDFSAPEDVIVAEAGGELAGYVHVGRVHETESNSHVLEIKSVAVSPSHRRHGIGQVLMSAGIEAARQRHARRIVLHVLGSNPAARRLYERAGFEIEGLLREQFLLDGRYVDDVLMALDLTQSSSS